MDRRHSVRGGPRRWLVARVGHRGEHGPTAGSADGAAWDRAGNDVPTIATPARIAAGSMATTPTADDAAVYGHRWLDRAAGRNGRCALARRAARVSSRDAAASEALRRPRSRHRG